MDMSEQYVTLAQVRELLEAEAEIRGYDNLLQSHSISLEQANAIIDEVKQIDIVSDAVALKIADLLPRYPEDVRAIFSKERVTLEPQQIQQIIDIVEKHI